MAVVDNKRPQPDRVIVDLAKYAYGYKPSSQLAYETARLTLIDSLACAFEALAYPDCTKLLGPIVPGTLVPQGARVPGTSYVLDPVTAAFNAGALIRWLDFNDAFYGRTVIHPSDNIGAILMTADWLSRTRVAAGKKPLAMREVLTAIIKAYEVQGGLALENGFTANGLDHTILVKIASTAAVSSLIGCSQEEIVNALSNAWVDGHALATYRRKPNTGSRKSWAAGDASARAVWLALLAKKGEMGYPSALTAPKWGFYEVLFKGRPFKFQRPLGSYVIENTLFKIPYPTAFHGQTGVEAAIKLHPLVKDRLDEIERVEARCHNSTMVILDKTGPLANFADRDHCMQYMMAVGLIFGEMTAKHYEDEIAADPRIDRLRAKIRLTEYERYEREYHDPSKRTNANSIQVFFKDGTKTPLVEISYPLGHRKRRKEGIPAVMKKFDENTALVFAAKQKSAIVAACTDQKKLEAMAVNEFVDLLVR
jgi:2-methylcitrate dehydratase